MDIQTEPDFYTEVFSWGNDEFGQLGLGATEQQEQELLMQNAYPVPRFCSYNVTIRQISCGSHHVAFITRKKFKN
jgi:alpha-tubulin suppressor-like RCC1 family protein